MWGERDLRLGKPLLIPISYKGQVPSLFPACFSSTETPHKDSLTLRTWTCPTGTNNQALLHLLLKHKILATDREKEAKQSKLFFFLWLPFIVCPPYIFRLLLILDLEWEKNSPGCFFPFTAMQDVDCLLGLAGQISPNQPADIARAFRISGSIIYHLLSEKQRCGRQKFSTLDNPTVQFSLNQDIGQHYWNRI